jgi:hypothetical protein
MNHGASQFAAARTRARRQLQGRGKFVQVRLGLGPPYGNGGLGEVA